MREFKADVNDIVNEFQADAIYDEEKERRAGFHGTVCLNCQEDTGFGRGKEPMRYDIHWCSSKCWQEYWKKSY